MGFLIKIAHTYCLKHTLLKIITDSSILWEEFLNKIILNNNNCEQMFETNN